MRAEAESSYLQLTSDQFHLLSDWRYFAILNLITLPGSSHAERDLASRLGITEAAMKSCLERLRRLEMIRESEDGRLERVAPRYRTPDDVVNPSLRRSHQQTLELAQDSLARDPIDERDFSWVTFPLDRRKMNTAKALIRRFQDDLLDLLDQDSVPDEVYRLSVQLFPLTRSPSERTERTPQ